MAINTILGPFSPQTTAPQPTIVPIDSGTNSLIDSAVARGQQTPDQFAQQQNQGVEQTANQAFQSAPQARQQDSTQGYGYGQGSINDAIRNQYRAVAGKNISNLESSYSQNAVFQKSAALQQASAEAMARQNVSTQAYSKLMDAYNQTEAARAQVLSSILGAGGAVAGGAAAKRGGGGGGGGSASPGIGSGNFNSSGESGADGYSTNYR